jgi:hypothetical protein
MNSKQRLTAALRGEKEGGDPVDRVPLWNNGAFFEKSEKSESL